MIINQKILKLQNLIKNKINSSHNKSMKLKKNMKKIQIFQMRLI